MSSAAADGTNMPIGGQAVTNGVMMRGSTGWAVAVRMADGSIAVRSEPLRAEGSSRWAKVPVVRGVLALAESLKLGIEALKWSTAQSLGVRDIKMGPQLAVAAVIAIPIFVLLPALAAKAGAADHGRYVFGLIDGAIGVAMLLGYIAAVGRLPDVRRFFEYHGAEHKAVSAYEAGVELSPATAAPFTTRHPRCGTSFMLVVAVITALGNVIVGQPPLPVLLVARLAMVPVVVGVAYELLRFGADNLDRRWVRRAIAPGLAMQGLTTREPSPAQLEVAIAALQAAASAGAPDASEGPPTRALRSQMALAS
jgi:uncharacterized protein YqhQ